MRRMDRYNEEVNTSTSRTLKNQNLYQDFNMNPVYTDISSITNSNAYEIDTNPNKTYKTREQYQHLKEYQNIEIPESRKELNNVNYLSGKQENKIYDINSVLENARKNRTEQDELDTKRKIKNAYNILSGKNKKQLEEYREEKKKRITTPEEDELRDLIDTIASKTLAGEIDKETSVDLLSDLMATSVLDVVDGSGEIEKVTVTSKIVEINKDDDTETLTEIVETGEIKDISEKDKDKTDEVKVVEETNTSKVPVKDPDFYTRSMDLSDKDFELSDDFKEDKVPTPLKIVIVLLILVIIGIVGYILYQKFM